MKKAIYSLSLLSLFLTNNNVNAQIGIVVSPQSQCYNVSGNISAAYLSGSVQGANSYSWSVASPSSCVASITTFSNGAIAQITHPCCGVYTITCYAYSTFSLISTLTQTTSVICNGNISTSVSPGNPICPGTTALITATGAASYTWSTGSTSSSISVTPSVSTCYTVIGYNSSGCSMSGVSCIQVGPPPVISVSGNTSVCSGQGATLTANGASSYTWYTSQGTYTNSTIVLTPSATTCYSLVGANGSCFGYSGGCVFVSPGSNVSIIGNLNICAGQSTILYATGGSSLTWQPGGSTSSSIIVSPSVTTCYTLTGLGCTGFTSAVSCLTVNSSPIISISGNTAVCLGQTTTLTANGASSYTWYTSQGTFTNSAIVLTPSTTTCYSLAGSSGPGCIGYTGGCLIVSSGNSITITGNSTICNGSSTALYASGSGNYTWMPGGFVGDSVIVTPSVNTCYTVFGSSGSGCPSFGIKCITILPSSVSISGPNSICSGSYAILYASGATNYTWLPGGSNSLSIIVTPSVSTCYTLAGTGCSGISYAVKCVSVTAAPVISISGNTTVCAGTTVTLTASGATSYTWMSWPTSYTGSTIVLTPSATTCFSVMGSTGSGCFGYGGICVNVQSGNLSISGSTFICSGSSTTITASGAQTYTWFPGGLTGASVVLSPTATTCYTVFGNNQSGCNGSKVFCITVNPKPTISTVGGVVCAGQQLNLFASGASTYTWLPFNLNGSSIVITPSTSGCYTVIGTSSIGGCTNFATNCFSVLPSSSVTISGNNVSCSGNPVTLVASGAQNYTWYPGNITGTSITVTPSVNTCYTVVSNNFGCQSFAVKCISVQTGPTITTGGNTSICAGSSTTLFANGASSYTWLPGNLTGPIVVVTPSVSTCYTVVGTNSSGCVGLGYHCLQLLPKPTITTSGGFFCAGSTGVLSAQGANTYTWLPFGITGSSISITPSVSSCYTVIGTNNSGCTNSAVGCFSVLPSPLITVAGNSSVCAGLSTTLSAFGAMSYTWLPLNITGANVVVTPTASICYTVIGSNNNGCVSKVVKCINVQQGAFVNVSGANIICSGSSANLLASGASTYTWNTGSNSPFITVSPSVSTCYTVTGTTAAGCVGSAVKCISVQAQPVISIGGNTSICQGSGTTLFASGASSYQWNTGATTSTIFVAPSVTTVYTVTGSNGFCAGVKSVTVTVKPKPVITIFRADSVFNNDSILCAGNSAILQAVGGFSYTWSNGGFGSSIVVTPSVTTTYTVTGIGANGCSNSNIYTIFVSPCTGIAKHKTGTIEMSVYPNPSSGLLTLQGNEASKISFKVYDLFGRELINGVFTDTETIDLSSYSNGTYIFRFESGAKVNYKKLVLEK